MKRVALICLVAVVAIMAGGVVFAEPLSQSGILPNNLGRGLWIFRVRAADTTANTKIADFKSAAGVSKASIDIEGDAIVHDLSITGSLTPPLDYVNFATGLTVATDAAEFTSAGNLRVGTSGASKFTVAAASGDTVCAGTMGVTGASTLTGAVAANGGITVDSAMTIADTTAILTTTGIVNANGGLAVDTSNFTVSGSTGAVVTASTIAAAGAITGPVAIYSTAGNITAAQSGSMIVNTATSGTTEFVLPAAAAGLHYCFVEGADAGGSILIGLQAGDAIKAKVTNDGIALAPAAGTGVVDTAGTNVVSDSMCLVAIDATNWIMTSMSGTWASR